MNYLDDLGCEKAEKEYKLFTFPIEAGSQEKNGYEILKSESWYLEDYVLPTLESYIAKYIPRYCSAFSHPDSKIKKGTFYIGVDDAGYIHGIPSIQPITREIIYSYIMNNILLLRSANEIDCVKRYIDLIQIEIIELNKSLMRERRTEKQIYYNIKKLKKLQNKDRVMKENKEKILKRKNDVKLFRASINQAVHLILNDKKSKTQVIDLIKKKGTSTIKLCPEYKNIYGYCDVSDYWSLITEIKTKTFLPITRESAKKYGNNMTSPIFWALEWRDIKNKPTKLLYCPHFEPKYNYKLKALVCGTYVPKMLPCWIYRNPLLNLYLVKITFSGNIHPELFLEYKDSNNDWLRCYRTVFNNVPMCITIK
jgi:hypothetical protein